MRGHLHSFVSLMSVHTLPLGLVSGRHAFCVIRLHASPRTSPRRKLPAVARCRSDIGDRVSRRGSPEPDGGLPARSALGHTVALPPTARHPRFPAEAIRGRSADVRRPSRRAGASVIVRPGSQGSCTMGDSDTGPRGAGVIRRGMLLDRLSRRPPPGGVTLVCASAGSGKTMLVRSWIEAAGLTDRDRLGLGRAQRARRPAVLAGR